MKCHIPHHQWLVSDSSVPPCASVKGVHKATLSNSKVQTAVCVWIWQNSWNADPSSSSTSVPMWYVKLDAVVGLEDASTPYMFSHMRISYLSGWSNQLEDSSLILQMLWMGENASLILQMLTLRLSHFCYALWALIITETWSFISISDETNAWTLMMVALNSEQLMVCWHIASIYFVCSDKINFCNAPWS
jgi:hypothetical protein